MNECPHIYEYMGELVGISRLLKSNKENMNFGGRFGEKT